MKLVNLSILLCAFCFVSCQKGKNDKDKIIRLVTEWQGKEIVFPENIIFTRYAIDTVDWQIPQSDFKILVYIDSIGCTSCKLQFAKWKEMIATIDSITPRKASFLFFLQPKDLKEIRYTLDHYKFDYPICIDTADELNKINHFSSHSDFQIFLLDSDNKIVVIGNPINNISVKELYIKYISKENFNSANSIKTTATVNDSDINLGLFSMPETKRAVFTIENNGNQPLVILDTATSCGCAAVSFDKEPAAPGSYIKVYIDMTPKTTGFFEETITVKCNTPQSVRLKVRGQAA